LRGLSSVSPVSRGRNVVAVEVDLVVAADGLETALLSSFSLMSGSPAAATKVGNQSMW
jgi:hypothetical protein